MAFIYGDASIKQGASNKDNAVVDVCVSAKWDVYIYKIVVVVQYF